MLRSRSRFNGASASMPRMGRQHVRHVDGEGASTGPRHRCRGWTFFLGMHRLLCVASTGPRHRCRGWHRSGPGAFAPRGASTGPRHRCRGWLDALFKQRYADRTTEVSAGALIGHFRRRQREDGRRGDSRTRFNGASASMPRMGLCPGAGGTKWQALQRGLGIDAEDGTPHRGPRALVVKLQRGLGIDAEDGSEGRGDRTGRFGASTGPRHRCRGWNAHYFFEASIQACFNGASASMPRMVSQPRREYSCQACFNGASASMPRMALTSVLRLRRWRRLQRGLGIDAEDGSRSRTHPPGSRTLQRGLGIDAEDGTSRNRSHNAGQCASTGPRHRCRGWPRRN